MSTFTIDFFELSFLAEACIPPRPIARTCFWHNLTDKYWEQMSEDERSRLFEWLNRNWTYKESLEANDEDLLMFHNRFNPDNQYMVKVKFNNTEEEYRTFKHNDRYCTGTRKSVNSDYIVDVVKLEIKTND